MNPYISSQSCPRVFEFSFLYYLTSYDGMKLLALTPQVWQDVGEFFFPLLDFLMRRGESNGWVLAKLCPRQR